MGDKILSVGADGRKKGKTSGIYGVISGRAKQAAFFGSRNVDVRVRKLRSDYKLGRKHALLDKLGMRFSGDVEFTKMEECALEMFGMRMRRLAEEWMGKGYQVYGWTMEGAEVRGPEAVSWGPCDRLRQIAERFGMGDEEVSGVLDTLERGIEYNRGRG